MCLFELYEMVLVLSLTDLNQNLCSLIVTYLNVQDSQGRSKEVTFLKISLEKSPWDLFEMNFKETQERFKEVQILLM